MGMEPKFQHDCDRCEFLGHFVGHDVYECLNPGNPFHSLIARHGSNGDEYLSHTSILMEEIIGDGTKPYLGANHMQAILMGLAMKSLRKIAKKGGY